MTMNDAAAGEVLLPGPLTIRHISAIRETLRESLSAHPITTLNIPAGTEADISFVQLVLAAHVSAKAAGREIRLREPASGPLLDVLTRGGFLENADAGFWTMETISQ